MTKITENTLSLNSKEIFILKNNTSDVKFLESDSNCSPSATAISLFS